MAGSRYRFRKSHLIYLSASGSLDSGTVRIDRLAACNRGVSHNGTYAAPPEPGCDQLAQVMVRGIVASAVVLVLTLFLPLSVVTVSVT